MVAALAATSSPNTVLAVSNMIGKAATDCYLSLQLRLRVEGFQASGLGIPLLVCRRVANQLLPTCNLDFAS